jgi:hypothetical protein
MTTTTKTRPSAELAKLIARDTKARTAARKAKAAVTAWDDEVAALRSTYTVHVHTHRDQYTQGPNPLPLPDTEAATLAAEVKSRMQESNPHQEAYEAARASFHEVNEELERFRRHRLVDLIAEREADVEAATEEIRKAFVALVDATGLYAEEVEAVRELVRQTPGLDGQSLAYDLRPAKWRTLAVEALGSDLERPRITEQAAWKLSR